MYEKSILPSTRKERKQSFGKRLTSEAVSSQVPAGERRFGSMAVSFIPKSVAKNRERIKTAKKLEKESKKGRRDVKSLHLKRYPGDRFKGRGHK